MLGASIPSGLPTDDVIHIRNLRKVYGGTDATHLFGFMLGFVLAFGSVLWFCPSDWAFTAQSVTAICTGVVLGVVGFFLGTFYRRQREISGKITKVRIVGLHCICDSTTDIDCHALCPPRKNARTCVAAISRARRARSRSGRSRLDFQRAIASDFWESTCVRHHSHVLLICENLRI
eukprot:SAG11_NODE_1058_length_6003_cov_1.474424_2_plen_176_part_00